MWAARCGFSTLLWLPSFFFSVTHFNRSFFFSAAGTIEMRTTDFMWFCFKLFCFIANGFQQKMRTLSECAPKTASLSQLTIVCKSNQMLTDYRKCMRKVNKKSITKRKFQSNLSCQAHWLDLIGAQHPVSIQTFHTFCQIIHFSLGDNLP